MPHLQSDGSSLSVFGSVTRTWFESVFEAPTAAQEAAWRTISTGQNCLVIAPTGSGKTLAAFLHSIDRLASQQPTGKVKVLYISPLKALAADVERNLRAPLRGIELAAARLGQTGPQIRVGVRSGDTPPAERRRLQNNPPDILITTPESLFLMLSSQAGQMLDEVDTIIVDEVHALAGTKRGAHLALSLERVDALRAPRQGEDADWREAQRIGLSATVRPAEQVAAFLAGDRPVTIVDPPSEKSWELTVEVPVEDMTELSNPPGSSPDDDEATVSNSIWPFLEHRILELVDQHRSTICFVNSRRVAERLTAHLNELHAARTGGDGAGDPAPGSRPPAQMMAQSGQSSGVDDSISPVIARAHHGSVSKDRRTLIEAELKAGTLPCVVATSSLELGIDMGAVDLVIQVSAPPSVASGLQRIGRAGHQVGATSRGVVLPTHRQDLLEATTVVDRMRTGLIEHVRLVRNPLDVLAQHLVSMCVDRVWRIEEALALVRRSSPFRTLPDSAWEGVLDMLSGRYPSEDFAELRPRLVWDRVNGTLQGRPGARRLVTTSGGTIPDRGLFGVFLVGEGSASGKHEAGRRVGELDEEMVYESRVGDVFTLGTSAWRIHEITPNQVLVTPAPGQPGRLPFWHGDQPRRPAELGEAIGRFAGDLARSKDSAGPELLGLDSSARWNLMTHLTEQERATGVVPDASTIVVERFRDELGDWRVCVHSSAGRAVLQPWALVIEARARERHGVEAQATASNDGIVLRIPDIDNAPPGADLIVVDPADIEELVTQQVFGSALFASRFRECAARALLLPRRDPSRRSPLWQQRMRSAQLLSVASQHADFPIILETMRECLEDVFDLPAVTELLTGIASRRIRLVEVETDQPSPRARSLLFGYVGEFIYDGDQPLAERKLAALSLDPTMLAELLGREGARQVLAPDVIEELTLELQHLVDDRKSHGPEPLWDMLRTIGPLTAEECAQRCTSDPSEWLEELLASGRVGRCHIGGKEMFAVADDFAILRDALGIPVPAGIATPAETLTTDDAIDRLATRWSQSHPVMRSEDLVVRFGLPGSTVARALDRQVARGRLVVSDPNGSSARGPEHMGQQILGIVRRRTLARLRASVEAVDPRQFSRFLADWHELTSPGHGIEAVAAAVELLAGYPVPVSMVDSLILPARVADYQPSMLDELITNGDVVWTGAGALGRTDGWIRLWPSDCVLAPDPQDAATQHGPELSPRAGELLEALTGGGAWRSSDLLPEETDRTAVHDALWELVWAGLVTCDSLAGLRASSTRGALKHRPQPRPSRRSALRQARLASQRTPGATLPGRWSIVRPSLAEPTEVRLAEIDYQLARYGVLTRGSVLTESFGRNFSETYRALMTMETSGAVRRGYFVEGLGAAQFALPGAVDRLRESNTTSTLLLAACDPANPFGASLPWPSSDGHRPTRKAGALVVLHDGQPQLYLERGVRTMVTFTQSDGTSSSGDELRKALRCLARAVQDGSLEPLTIDRINQTPALQQRELGKELTDAGFVMTPQGFRLRRGSGLG
ncbi:DEAD/DEAH box helicase [Luteococcus sp. Sow4_B9]|uniref:DEAD/DEAH box helicase n=1 Tax=Luteococcus sp. Sow4_B9 TaxID=3438792 RepID=UPI003F9DECEE